MAPVVANPSTEYESAFLAMVADFEVHDVDNASHYAAAKPDFEGYVEGLLNEERGINLKDGWVPCSHRWLVEGGGTVVGVARVRHHINTPFLANEGGHIGYDIAPSLRGRGYGHLALRVALAEAQRLRIQRVLLIANENNEASRKVIERQGGELEATAISRHANQRVCRYWIQVSGDDG